jgi:hypothetical protein
LKVRLAQLKQLADQFGPRAINWRFDPICHFKTGEGNVQDNLDNLDRIAAKAAEFGIERCITSFMDPYRKIEKRLADLQDFSFSDPPLKTKQEIILKMEAMLASENMRLMLCCEKAVLEGLPSTSTVAQSACIPNDLLIELFGGSLSLKRDSGQRIQQGCGCNVSVDIGIYHQHPCYHNCLFCYANPTPK